MSRDITLTATNRHQSRRNHCPSQVAMSLLRMRKRASIDLHQGGRSSYLLVVVDCCGLDVEGFSFDV